MTEIVEDGVVDDPVIDVDKLVALVETRPELYVITRKDHHNQDVIAKAWQHIGQEMKISGNECKSKWHVLRSSYARYLRDLKKMPSGSGGKKKKWYLADAMSFLLPYIGNQKSTTSNMVRTRTDVAAEERTEENLEQPTTETDVAATATASTSSSPTPADELNPRKKKAKTPAEVVAEPMAAYFKSITEKKPTEEHPMMHYFRGLMPEIEKLSATSQRRFKMDVLRQLNYYLDQEEGVYSSQPNVPQMSPASASCSSHGRNPSSDSTPSQLSPQEEYNILQLGGYHDSNGLLWFNKK